MSTLFNKVLDENEKWVFICTLKPKELFGQPTSRRVAGGGGGEPTSGFGGSFEFGVQEPSQQHLCLGTFWPSKEGRSWPQSSTPR